MNRRLAAEISLIAGAIGFFLGGLISFKKEIVEIMMAATITGVLLAFLVYFIMYVVYYEQITGNKRVTVSSKQPGKKTDVEKQKGTKIDFVSDDEDDDIHKEIFK